MLGHKARDFRPLTAVSLEDLVPEDNFYRQVERTIDLSFVRDLVKEFYIQLFSLNFTLKTRGPPGSLIRLRTSVPQL